MIYFFFFLVNIQYTSSELLMTVMVQPICFDLGKIVYDFLHSETTLLTPTIHLCGHKEVATGNKAEPDRL